LYCIATQAEHQHSPQTDRQTQTQTDRQTETWSRVLRLEDLGGRPGGRRSGSELAAVIPGVSDLW